MRQYFARKLAIYLVTFFVAVTIDWMIPRFMPGDPVQGMVSRMSLEPEAANRMMGFFLGAFGLDKPIWEQYLNFWVALAHGDLGISVWQFPTPVLNIILSAVPYTLALLIPAILLSWVAGNQFGAWVARRKRLDNTVLPVGYILTATPYMWLGILIAWGLGSVLRVLPLSGAFNYSMSPTLTWEFFLSVYTHWLMPFLSLFLVMFGGWAIGMRNMIIYELESDYAHWLEALGAPQSLVRRYAFRNAVLPQVTGLALSLGVVVAGALVTEVVFSYPGLGYLVLQAIQNEDYFLLQGIFLFVIIGVLVANFLIDIAYVVVDPRTRVGMQGRA
ncbi:MAG: ABC transporter permease [Chloroflexi bacterium]|nr:ABC transporter permease [Chloroflexota bacterium]